MALYSGRVALKVRADGSHAPAYTFDYNNGLAEGSVTKIKLIKRIMYGRNSFALLKAKVLMHELLYVNSN